MNLSSFNRDMRASCSDFLSSTKSESICGGAGVLGVVSVVASVLVLLGGGEVAFIDKRLMSVAV